MSLADVQPFGSFRADQRGGLRAERYATPGASRARAGELPLQVTAEEDKRARAEGAIIAERRLFVERCAIAALTGLLMPWSNSFGMDDERWQSKIAARVFELGEAMLAERERRFK